MVKSISWPLPFGRQDGQFKLDRIKKALNYLDNPEKQMKNVIHIGGTNGKGSSLAFLEKIFLTSGFTVCSYISPSLLDLNERFRVNSLNISDELLLLNIGEVRTKLAKHNFENELTFFEGLTVVAFWIFAKLNYDFNIIEVGLGGRFDATNAIETKLATLITQISLDHTEYLGNTHQKIAIEKMQIMRNDAINVVSYQNNKSVYDVFVNSEFSQNQNLYLFDRDFNLKIKSDNKFFFRSKHFENDIVLQPSLKGSHQYYNATNAVFLAKMIAKKIGLNDKITDSVIAKSISNTFWLARMQSVFESKEYEIIIDGGHNEGSVFAIFDFIKNNFDTYHSIQIIYGALKRKDIISIAKKLKSDSIENYIENIMFCKINTFEECHNPEYVFETFTNQGFTKIKLLYDLEMFLKNITSSKNNNTNTNNKKKLIFVFGSLYLCGEVLTILNN